VATTAVSIKPSAAAIASEGLPGLALTGKAIKLNASGSAIQCGTVEKYDWDLDGDGTFEAATGATATVSHIYNDVGVVTPRVRVTRAGGRVDVATMTLNVRLSPPVGEVGVSINDGAQFTNNPTVTINPTWPGYTKQVTISNDGGFRKAKKVDIGPGIDWKLESSGPERLPKTVYVRFDAANDKTYTDDIILDETAPVVTAATLTGGAAKAARAAKKRKLKIRIKAKDNLSGVAFMQVTAKKKKPGKWLKHRKTASIKTSASAVWVRVQDKAGNASKWKKVVTRR
jgi:hypothetical protein